LKASRTVGGAEGDLVRRGGGQEEEEDEAFERLDEEEDVLVMVHRGAGGGEGVREVAIVDSGRVAGEEKGEGGRAWKGKVLSSN